MIALPLIASPFRKRSWILGAVLWCVAFMAVSSSIFALSHDDAYIHSKKGEWSLGSSAVERVVALEDGRLVLKSLKDKRTGRELVTQGKNSAEFSVSLGEKASSINGASGGWKLVRAKESKLSQGELALDLTVARDKFEVTRHYVIYPQSSVIREWTTFTNTGKTSLTLINPGFLDLSVRPASLASLDFYWMSGGTNFPNSWLLRKESLDPARTRRFDSYDPSSYPHVFGDGVNVKILKNGSQVWPAQGWRHLVNSEDAARFDLALDLGVGDRLAFVVNRNKTLVNDATDLNLVIDDGKTTHSATQEFSNEQGRDNWRYQAVEGNEFKDLVFDKKVQRWVGATSSSLFLVVGGLFPGEKKDVARVWVSPKAGRITIKGAFTNIDNPQGGLKPGFKPGNFYYAPWYALHSRDTGQGVLIGWDYFGHWISSFKTNPDGTVGTELHVINHRQRLAPGESLTTPKAFVGFYSGDLDEAGNELLDWQYRYLWDYTRPGWFPAVRVCGCWAKGTGWDEPGGADWLAGKGDRASIFRKVFRVVDLMSQIGGDVYHRDWGWWDVAGDWNGPDWRVTHDYLAKHDMGQLIYAFIYSVSKESRVAREHPDWNLQGVPGISGPTMDVSRPEVRRFLIDQLDSFVKRWGSFEWRNDSAMTVSASANDDTLLLGQDAGLREIFKTFLDRHPDCAFQAVNGGGWYSGYDYVRYSSMHSFTDGMVGPRSNYYTSLLFPPDKTAMNPDWYGELKGNSLLCFSLNLSDDTWDPVKLEGLRELIDIYHYLFQQGVVGRWVKVYRPVVQGDDPEMYLQRLSGDRKRGIIIHKLVCPGPVAIWPKGLIPEETYEVTCHNSDYHEWRTGSDLMKNGFKFKTFSPGELIYFNLPYHPGNKLDKTPPSSPHAGHKQVGENMGYPGIEITWKPGKDDQWVSYYEILRDGTVLDKVAKGTFYFDHSVGADLGASYEIRTVDAAGNKSKNITAKGSNPKPAQIIDDASAPPLVFSGLWEKQEKQSPAHAGTITRSKTRGATFEVPIDGKSVLLFVKLGPEGGKAEVRIDDGAPEVIDTYSADDIWGICIYKKAFSHAGRHTLRLTVLGEHHPRGSDNFVSLDGLRIAP